MTSPLLQLLLTITADLKALKAPAALIGGLAVSARTEPRFTRDIDLALAVKSDSEAEEILSHLIRGGYRIAMQIEHEAVGRLATARLIRGPLDDPNPIVDLMFSSCGIEPEIVKSAQPIEVVAGIKVPVARVEHLIAMKVLSVESRRPQDRSDLQALLAVATPGQLHAVRELLKLITDRGYHRRRNLNARFARLLKAK